MKFTQNMNIKYYARELFHGTSRNFFVQGRTYILCKRNAHLILNFFVPPLGRPLGEGGGQKFTWLVMSMGVLLEFFC